MEPLVVAEHLYKTYRDGTRAVVDVSFEAGRGVTVLMGPNGSGKTTTLSMIAGALKPSRGRVLVCSYDLWGDGWYRARECIGYAPQRMPFVERLTVLENLVWIGLMRGLSLGEARRRARRLLEEVGLPDAGGKLVGRLSGGMRRRVTIAASLVGDPRVVVLDEPTSGLDPGARESLWRIIRGFSGERAVLVSTHIPVEAEEYADKVLVFHRGRLVAEGPPGDLIARYAPESLVEVEGVIPPVTGSVGWRVVEASSDRLVIASRSPDSDLPRLIEWIVSRGGRVGVARVRRPGLREVYFALTGEALEEGG